MIEIRKDIRGRRIDLRAFLIAEVILAYLAVPAM
jgi:hypothetical protein